MFTTRRARPRSGSSTRPRDCPCRFVPKLEAEPSAAPVAAVATAEPAPAPPPAAASTQPPPPAPHDNGPAPVSSDGSTQRTAGWIVGGIGVVGLGLGSYFGLRAVGKWHDSDAECPTSATCTSDGATASEDAGKAADISTVSFIVGGVGVGVGAVLLLTAPSGESGKASAWLRPSIGPRGGGALVGGRF